MDFGTYYNGNHIQKVSLLILKYRHVELELFQRHLLLDYKAIKVFVYILQLFVSQYMQKTMSIKILRARESPDAEIYRVLCIVYEYIIMSEERLQNSFPQLSPAYLTLKKPHESMAKLPWREVVNYRAMCHCLVIHINPYAPHYTRINTHHNEFVLYVYIRVL